MIGAATAILEELRELGIRVKPRAGGKLNLAPKARITPELIQKVREHKAELLTLLAQQEAGRKAASYERAREVAIWCQEYRIDASVGAAILAIEAEALRQGWPHGRLWGSKFWPIEVRGLIAIMDPGDLIVAVDADVITFRRPNPHGSYSEFKFRKFHG